MSEIRPPILVFPQTDEVLVFKDIKAAESYMEPQDVRAGEYRVYDSVGHRLLLETAAERRPGLLGLGTSVEGTRISSDDSRKFVDELRSLIRRAMTHSGRHEHVAEDAALDELVALIVSDAV